MVTLRTGLVLWIILHMIDIVNKKDCFGCNTCGDVCPKDGIRFEKDDAGFLYPVIDK